MDNKKMGQFICELRKSRQMTQKDLSEKLNITDKAVSKWERGLSCPDIALLSPIADILGVTVGELLNGEKSTVVSPAAESSIDNALLYAGQKTKNTMKSIHNIFFVSFSLFILAGILVCAICDKAISGSYTWSLFPISAAVFVWLVLSPAIKYGRKGIAVSLAALSLLVFPFIYILYVLVSGNSLFLSIGFLTSLISVMFLWIVFGVFHILKHKKWIAAGITALAAIIVELLINLVLVKTIGEPMIDIWDLLTLSILLAMAAVFFITGSIQYRKNN